ncbi:MAG TPA: hypothetical protein VNU01_06300, partial [Egibacteraceae bacterium]|nr:hypothetical protein [Egibacteraceae bacterium]
MTDLDTRLREASHGVLLCWDGAGASARLLALASPAWWDGAGVWMLAPMLAAGAPEALRGRPPCALLLDDGDGGLALRGSARLFGLHDPVGLALHAPAIAGAMAALALRGAATLRRALPGTLPREPALRVAADAMEPFAVAAPRAAGGGIAPALPADVPPDVRRDLAGVRDVVVLAAGSILTQRAVWGAGLSLGGARVAAGRAAVVARSGRTGLALEGEVGA